MHTAMSDTLHIGDKVYFKSVMQFEKVRIKRIELCDEGKNNGIQVNSVDWSLCSGKRVVVDLSNGQWAWGYQLEQFK
jgi:hypothetical protein